MIRNDFCQWFADSKGRILFQNESRYLRHAITLSYTDLILQIGYLGWEQQFIDCSAYRGFIILDQLDTGHNECARIRCPVADLGIASDSIDMVILPHLLEFERDRYQILREVERILKPEGELIILGFNPWSLFSLDQIRRRITGSKPHHNRFISRLRIIDWLHMLNFDAEISAGFQVREIIDDHRECLQKKQAFWITSYAIRAIKRRFNVIPLNSSDTENQAFALAGSNLTSSILKHND